MARLVWPHLQDRPRIQVVLTMSGGQPSIRDLLADTGAGNLAAMFDLVLEETDCILGGGVPSHPIVLGGAFTGTFPVYLLRTQIPGIGFDEHVLAVGVPATPPGFHGIAAFPFLNRFSFGNFANPGHFGLEQSTWY